MKKSDLCLWENKDADQISAFVLASRIEQSFFFVNSKFQATNILLSLYRPVCGRPCMESRRTQKRDIYNGLFIIIL